MKLFIPIISLFLLSLSLSITSNEKAVRGAKFFGFFADFLWTINHLEFCVAHDKTPVIYWKENSSYFDPSGYNGSTNVWEYYFEPVSKEFYNPSYDTIYLEEYYPRSNNFSALWDYDQYISNKYKLSPEEQRAFKPISGHEKVYLSYRFNGMTLNSYPVGRHHLYGTAFRKKVKAQIIDQFIKIKLSIKDKIEAFYKEHMAGKKTIGIHLRGTHIGREVLPVPLEVIFNEANQYANLGYQFFIATDQFPLIEAAKNSLRGNVIYYECERFQSTTSPYGTFKLPPKLGEDILIEASLLSQTDHLIHTLSNVSTAVLYFNPELPHTVIY